jgi:hypothetical protein
MEGYELVEVDGYAHWAAFLINGDDSGLERSDILNIEAWAKANSVTLAAASCSDESFFGYPDGIHALKGDCVTYTFFVRE